jgi:hypothetical protein
MSRPSHSSRFYHPNSDDDDNNNNNNNNNVDLVITPAYEISGSLSVCPV